MKDLTINLKTEEEKDRYNYIKDLVQRLYPKVASDITLGNMSEYLYVYYAIHEKFPDPPEGAENEMTQPIDLTNIPLMEEYYTPANISETLNYPEEESDTDTDEEYEE